MSDLNVEKIMGELKSNLNPHKEDIITEKNVVQVAVSMVQDRMKMILNQVSTQSEKLKYLQSLNFESTESPAQGIRSMINNDLHQANISVDIQTQTKIDTSKPKMIRPLVLKIRHMLQNEIRSTLNPIVNNQIRYNSHSISALNLIAESVKENSQMLESVNEQIQNTLEVIKQQIAFTEVCSGYNELLKRTPTDSEISEYVQKIIKNDISFNEFRSVLQRSPEYSNVLEATKYQDLLSLKKMNEAKNYILEVRKQRNSAKPTALFYVDFMKIMANYKNPFSERHTELFWLLKNLPTDGLLLDVGCLESELANELTKIKTLKVYGIDIRLTQEKTLYEFRQESATNVSFADKYFDLITAISSLEHFGLDVYGSEKNDDADKLAIKEIKRIIKPNGLLFITVPFGKNSKSWSRVYNVKSLQSILQDFEIMEEKYYMQEDDGWMETTRELAELNEGAKYGGNELSSGAIACIIAKPKE